MLKLSWREENENEMEKIERENTDKKDYKKENNIFWSYD